MAPGAKIVLAIASSDEWSDLTATELAMIKKYPGAVISESFGLSEPSPRDAAGIREIAGSFANHLLAWRLGTTVVAAAGDLGAGDGVVDANGKAIPTADYPSSDPLVTGVGGTMGLPYPDGLWSHGRYGGEQTWNESDFGLADGGGPSALFPQPSYQRGLATGSRRMTPDVAFNAAIDGGVQVAVTINGFLGRYVVGGNSAGAPQWAGIIALANELRGRQGKAGIGFANPVLYSIAADRRSTRGSSSPTSSRPRRTAATSPIFARRGDRTTPAASRAAGRRPSRCTAAGTPPGVISASAGFRPGAYSHRKLRQP